MQSIVIVLGMLLIAGLLVHLAGHSLAATQEITIETRVNAPAARVWAVMTAWTDQPTWRSGIARVEMSGSDRFAEYPKRGNPIHFRILASTAPKRLELGMSGPVTGTYLAELFEEKGVTRIRAVERIKIENPFKRIVNRLFFDLETFAKTYLAELKSRVEIDSSPNGQPNT